jgi:hypothetical protein
MASRSAEQKGSAIERLHWRAKVGGKVEEWDAEPNDLTERIGDVLGADDARIQGDVDRFKKFIEERRSPTGAWRGEVRGGRVEGDRADIEAGTRSRG